MSSLMLAGRGQSKNPSPRRSANFCWHEDAFRDFSASIKGRSGCKYRLDAPAAGTKATMDFLSLGTTLLVGSAKMPPFSRRQVSSIGKKRGDLADKWSFTFSR